MKNWSDKPSLMSFDDALRKGFGRALIWTKSGYANAPQLIDACLNDYRFDRQVEDARGDWLWRIAKASSIYDAVKDSILDALDNISHPDAECQLCQLAAHFANDGDNRFRLRRRGIVGEKPVEELPWLGEKELMRLDGDDGFLLALRRHAADLRTREWDWFDAVFVDDARKVLGEQHISDLLAKNSASEPSVGHFVELFSRESKSTHDSEESRAAYRRELASLTADDVIAAAESPEKTQCRFRGWGRQATSADLEVILERMLDCENEKSLERYLQVFAARELPRFDARILGLCQHENLQVRSRATTAAANNRNPEVRAFAIRKLAESEYQGVAIQMLVKNYERGDEQPVLDAIVLPNDNCDRHSMLLSLLKLIEDNSAAEYHRAAELIYEQTPCSLCRYWAVQLLAERDALPEQMRAECQFDVEPDTRAIVGGPAWNDLAG